MFLGWLSSFVSQDGRVIAVGYMGYAPFRKNRLKSEPVTGGPGRLWSFPKRIQRILEATRVYGSLLCTTMTRGSIASPRHFVVVIATVSRG